jgi:hypothetical protein
LGDFGRKIGLGLRQTVLDVDLIDVGLRVDIERHGERHRAVVGIGRLHVQHVVGPVHLLFERCRHGLLDRERVGARILRRHQDLRRHDLRKLRDRQPAHGHQSAEDRDDGDDDRDNGSTNEESRHYRASVDAAGCGDT